jgi:transglutaminase-like putative cysteine protease
MTRLRTREGKLSFFLLMLMMLSIAWSMELSGWVEGLYVVEWTALGGLTLGFLLTRLGWRRVWSHLVGTVIGALLILAVVGRFVGPGLDLRDGVGMVAYHFDAWLSVVLAGQASTDAVAFVLLVTLLGWWLGYASAWMVFGAHQVWQALLLTGGAMLVVAYASPPKGAPFFVMYLFCALLLAIRLYVYTQEQTWTRRQARYDNDITLSFLRDGGLLILAVLMAVWIVPLLSSSSAVSNLWARFEEPWRAVGDEWNRVFSGVLGYNRGYENIPYGENLALGGPVDLSDQVVMWAETDGPRYWRGAVYDHYDGSGWHNTQTLSAVFPAERALPVDGSYEMRELVEQIVLSGRWGVSQVFYTGQPSLVDLPVEATYEHIGDVGDGAPDPWSAPASVSMIKTRVPVSPERPYTVFSSTSTADVTSLREAGVSYPDWVSSHYLQLPPGLPERVGALAAEIVGPHENPYDRAVSIRDYLRRTIEYREDIQRSPEDRDPIDYLLFDVREGYCNYYASAMVIMARSVGIPARLAVGYVGGELEEDTGRYVVRELNRHAWVEMYFPRFGWVEFEPTASEPAIARQEQQEEERAELPGAETESQLERDLARLEDEDEGSLGVLMPTVTSDGSSTPLAALAAVAVCVGVAGVGLWYLQWRRRVEETSRVGRIYRRMCSYAGLLGVKGETFQTPHEYASLVVQRVPESTPHAERIAELYVRDRFARGALGKPEERDADEAWEAMRPLVWRGLLHRIPELVQSALRGRVRTGVRG